MPAGGARFVVLGQLSSMGLDFGDGVIMTMMVEKVTFC